MKFAVVRTGGKQYLVKENDELYVDRLAAGVNDEVELETLAQGQFDRDEIQLGQPLTATKVKAKIVTNLKGDKIRILRFKAKVRHHRRRGFRQLLTKLKIIRI